MLACRGGLAIEGPSSPDSGRAFIAARKLGLAPGCRPVFFNGEPTGPKGLESAPFLPAKNAPKREGDAVDGEPTFDVASAGVPKPDSDDRNSSSADREKRRAFSAGVRRSCKLFGTISSSSANASSHSSLSSIGGRAPTLAESIRAVFLDE